MGSKGLKLGNLKHGVRRRIGPRLQRLAFESGFMQFMKRRSGSGGAIVLMYHSIAGPEHEQWIDPRNHVPADVFAEQMAFLAAHRRPISLEALVEQLASGRPVEDGAVVVTFDDGYLDNLTVAAPILERWRIPATLFLPTGYIDRGETQWVDQAYTAFQFRSRSMLAWGNPPRRFDLDQPAERQEAYREVCLDLLRADADTRQRLLGQLLGSLLPTAAPPRLTLNWEEVRELVTTFEGFRIGGHTVEHLDLTSVGLEAAKDELRQSARTIEAQLGHAPRHFSFCYGRSNAPLRGLLEELGIDAAFGGCNTGPVICRGADRLRLPRVEGPRAFGRFDMATSSANTQFWRRLGR